MSAAGYPRQKFEEEILALKLIGLEMTLFQFEEIGILSKCQNV